MAAVEGVDHCTGCGMWIMTIWLECPACKKPIAKGDSDAESNQMEGIMLGAGRTGKGED
jgi:hypothetical protein